MKLLMVLDHLSIDSGVSSVVMNIYKNVDLNKINIDFLIFKDRNDSYISYVESKGSKVYTLPNPLSPKSLIKSIKALKTFFKLHCAEYDIVHLHSPTLNEFTLKYAKRYNIPYRIVHSHSTMTSPILWKKYVNSFLQRHITKYANYYFSCSTEAAYFLYGKKFCENNKIFLIKNAVDTDKFKYSEKDALEIKKKLNLGDSKIAIHVSNFSKIKNVSFLVPIIKEIAKNNLDYKFMFVGEGPTKKNIEELVAKYDINKFCIFTGYRSDIDYLLNVADVLLLPSIKEGLPVSVIEAQANGLKCIISDTITKEADAGNVVYLPLNEKLWVEEIRKLNPISTDERLEKCNLFSRSGFNIINEAKRIEGIYLSIGDTL